MSEQRNALLSALREKRLMAEALNGDGHGVYSPEWYTDRGWDSDLISGLTFTHRSDGTYKGSIWDGDGNMIPEIRGVYSLTFHEAVADILGIVEHHEMNGRGFRAQAVAAKVRQMIQG
jgi:hypothetical protein